MFKKKKQYKMDHHPIIVVQSYDTSLSKMWKAITEKEEMKKWYFDLADFKAEKGFRFQFTGGPTPERQYLHLCEVTEVIAGKKLTYSWRYDGYRGCSFVTFELNTQENRTLLQLTHQDLETFPEENPDFAKGNFEEGWNQIIHHSLKNYLDTGC